MADGCLAGQYRDPLIKECMPCTRKCQRPLDIPRCTAYCESANCRALPGHHYDVLLKKCLKCVEVCGKHPAECSQHCHTPPATTAKLPLVVSSHVPHPSMPRGLEDSALVLYPLLALCMVLLLTSLSLALVVLLRESRAKRSKPRPKEANHNLERVVHLDQEVGQPGQSSKDFVPTCSYPTEREPSDDSSPTETCVCVHCFPDLKALGQGNDRPLRAPFSFYPQIVPQKGAPLRTDGHEHTFRQTAQEEAAVG